MDEGAFTRGRIKPALRGAFALKNPAVPTSALAGSFTLNYFGKPIRILENPSPKQLQGFLGRTKYKAARRIVDPDTGAVYVWDADNPALHKMVADELGVKYDPKRSDMIGLDD